MKKFLCIAITLCFILAAAACGQKGGDQPETQTIVLEETLVTTTEAQTEAETTTEAETPAQTEEESLSQADGEETLYEDNFAVDQEAVIAYATAIKAAVANQDIEALADLTAFPVYVGLEGLSDPVIQSKEDFIALGAENVINEAMTAAIAAADETALSPSMAGFTLMEGTEKGPSITFGVMEGKLGITGINY